MTNNYLSYSATAILQAISHGYRYGFDVMDATGLPSGTVYPALRRMESVGLIVSRWEEAGVAQREQRPARKYYQLTTSGRTGLAEAAARYRLADPAPHRIGKPSRTES
jgi:DNA-binding PadR family transcriptional regulator